MKKTILLLMAALSFGTMQAQNGFFLKAGGGLGHSKVMMNSEAYKPPTLSGKIVSMHP